MPLTDKFSSQPVATRMEKVLSAIGICVFLVVAGLIVFCINLLNYHRRSHA
jgi:cell division protein FtsL